MERARLHGSIGARHWAVADSYLPQWSEGPKPELESHETLCFLNTNQDTANIRLWVYFDEAPPQGPYVIEVPGERTRHIRLNDLKDPSPIPRGSDFAVVVESDRAVVVQQTRLDSRQAANALFSTLAFPA